MSIKSRLFSIFSFSVLLAFTACNKDDEGSGQFSKPEAQSKISSFNSSATADLQALADTEGLQVVKDFFALVNQDDPFGRIGSDQKKVRSFLRKKGHEFRSVFAPNSISGRTKGEEAFDFNANKGVYEWDEETQEFVKTGASSIIRILFPTEGSTENDAELQLTAYAEQLVSDEFGDFYEPTLLKARVLVDNAEKAALNLEIDLDDAGFPVAADIALSVSPFTASLSFDNTGTTTSSISVSLTKAQETLVSTGITVKYSSSSKDEESLSRIEGHVQLKSMKLQGYVDFTNSNAESLNDIVKLALYADGKKVGDVVFETSNGTDEAYLKYADGTKQKMEDVFQPVMDELHALQEDLG